MKVRGEVCRCYSISIFLSSRRRHTRCGLGTGVQTCALPISSEESENKAQYGQTKSSPVYGGRGGRGRPRGRPNRRGAVIRGGAMALDVSPREPTCNEGDWKGVV